ncbi:MAG: hypothetical protein NWP98_11375 [Erythrobacter sp.]|nr:hypothetical protein [Erythrobacter sp.]
MLNRVIPALAVLVTALAPASGFAQAERTSPLPNYNLVQLSVAASDMAAADFQTRTAAIRSCGDAVKLGKDIGAEVNRSNFTHASELPPQLRPMLKDLPNGTASPVLSEDGTVLHVLVVCSRA